VKLRSLFKVLLVLFLIPGIFFIRCARPGSPSGGPKDVTPPEVRATVPPNRSVSFNAKKISISFDEFIQLKDPAKEIFISPPMRIRPEFKTNGKNITVEFKEELKSNSTYTINFGNSIIDFTESNALPNFEYVFSTGDNIDSLSISGKVINAFNDKPEAEIIAMVYIDENDTIPLDSLPLKMPPRSASRTIKDGSFSINNLAQGKYKLVALQDLNNNYIFDLPNERFAFLDSLVTILPPGLTIDTVDSTYNDTIAPTAFQIIPKVSFTLHLFEETDPTQRLLSKKLVSSSLLQYIFRMPVDSVDISLLNNQPVRPDWYIPEFSKMKDTLNFWLRSGLPDTIEVRLCAGDSLVDTTRFFPGRTTQDRPGKRKEAVKEALKIYSNTFAGSLDLGKNFSLFFASPIQYFDPGKLTLFTLADTLVPMFSFSDSLQRKGELSYKWLEKEAYKLLIEDSAFCDLSGLCNDSTTIVFKVRALEDYGNLLMDITLPGKSGQYLLQLLDEKEIIIQEKILASSGICRFEYLKPGNYKLKAIFDANSNGKWDTGKYKKNLLPERVVYYTLPLSIRANWDLQEEWKLQ
jgi:uncharacterized protein (DUF2141 family)